MQVVLSATLARLWATAYWEISIC